MQWLKGAMLIFAQCLCRGVGVQLKFTTGTPCTDGQVVYMPPLSETAPISLIKAWWGILVHEVGHILFTQFWVEKPNDPLALSFFGGLEDIRMERAVMRKFSGAHKFLSDLFDEWKDKLNVYDSSSPLPKLVTRGLHHIQRHEILGQKVFQSRAESAEQGMIETIGKGATIRLIALASQIVECKSTQDTVALAIRLRECIEQEAEQPPPSPENNDTSDESEHQSDSNGQQPDDSEGSNDSDGASDDASQSNDEGDQSSPTTSDDQPEQDAESLTPEQIKEALDKLLNATASDLSGEDDLVDGMLQQFSQSTTPYQASATNVTVSKRQPTGVDHDVLSKSDRIAGGLSQRLVNFLVARSEDNSSVTRYGTQFHGKWLQKAIVNDPKLFQRKVEAINVDTAVMILLDRSGSMSEPEERPRINVAVNSSAIVANALDRLPQVKSAIAAFPGYLFPGQPVEGDVEPLKDFDERFRPVSARIAINAGGGTPMAQAISWGTQELHMRSESRKIMVVITDGLCTGDQLTHAIKSAIACGIEIWGVGIDLDCSQLFPISKVVKDVNELAPTLLALFRQGLSSSRAA